MEVQVGTIILDYEKYEGYSLEKVINDNLYSIKELGANALSLNICNEHWHGSFAIPLAVGFSNPVNTLKGASISLIYSDQTTQNIFDELKNWNAYYQGKLVRPEDTYTFTSDKMTCSICTDDYKPGEKVITARKCNHIFHFTCLQNWRLHKKSLEEISIAKIMEETFQYKCPLCSETTD